MKRRLLAVLVFASVAAQSFEDRFRAELQTKAIEQPVADGVRVVVHAGDGGALAAGADILVIPAADWSDSVSREYQTTMLGAGDQWTMARHLMLLRFGRRWRTDDRGEAMVPANPVMWGAVRGDLWAWAPQWSDATIVLRPRLRVPVRVVAADGSPAATVPLRALNQVGYPMWVNAGHTDAAGASVLEFDFDNLLAPRLTIGVAWPMVEPYVDFAPRERVASGAREPLVVRLPELARLVVTATQPDGARRPLSLLGLMQPGDTTQRSSVNLDASADGEVVVVARPGQRLQAWLYCTDQVEQNLVEVQMPAKAGDTARVHLGELTRGLAVVRVLGPDGKPHANGWVQVDYYQHCASRCDAAGRLRWALNGREAPFNERVLAAVGDDRETNLGAAFVRLPPPEAGLVDLGDVRMQPEPILLRGRVVDGNGRPVPGAIVHHADVGPHASAVFDHPRTRCDGSGCFVLRGLLPRLAQIGVRAHRPRDLAQSGEGMFDVGASDVRIIVP